MMPFSNRKPRIAMMTNRYTGPLSEPDDSRLFTLENAGGMAVTISERGGVLCSWRTPDRYGRMADVLVGGRDASAGPTGAAPALRWRGSHAGGGVAMSLTSPGGRGDYRLDYHLDDDGNLTIDHHASARSAATLESPPHPCFNLNGGSTDVGDHMLRIGADYYVEIDGAGTPVGVATVGGTPFDFRQPAPIGARLSWPDSQTGTAGGFDHRFFVRGHYAGGQGALREAASVLDPGSGRCLRMYTTEAAVAFWAGKRRAMSEPVLAGASPAPGLGPDVFRLGPDALPNLASVAWPNVILRAGTVYRQTTVYRLSVQDQADGSEV